MFNRLKNFSCSPSFKGNVTGLVATSVPNESESGTHSANASNETFRQSQRAPVLQFGIVHQPFQASMPSLKAPAGRQQ